MLEEVSNFTCCRTDKAEPTSSSCYQRKKFNQVRLVNVSIMPLCQEVIHMHVVPPYAFSKKAYARPGLVRMCDPQSAPRWTPPRGSLPVSKVSREWRRRVDPVS